MSAMEYVPFYRVLQIENHEGPKEFTRGLVDRATDPKFKGSYDPVNNVFDNMERWISYSIRKGIGNKVAQNARKAMHENLPGQVSDRPLPPTAKHLKPGNTIAVWENGVLHKYHVEDPLMVHYFSGVQSVTLPLLNWSNKANRFFRGSIIYDPFFSAKQVMMDAYSAMFTSGVKNGFKIPILAVKEVIATLANVSKAHKELRAVGAVGDHNWSDVETRLDIEAAAGLRKPNLFERIVSGALKPLKWFSMVSDNAIRQAIYIQTLKETKSAEHPTGDKALAISRAFEVINFRRAGYSPEITFARQNVIFFGAYLQAMNVTAKVLSGRGIAPVTKKEAYTRLANIVVQVGVLSLLYGMLMGDDDEYKDTDPTVRDTHYLVPGLAKYGAWLPIRAEVFTMLSKMGVEHAINLMRKDGEDWTKFKKAFWYYLRNALTGPTAVPQLPKLAYELYANTNLNTDRPIVGQGVEGRAAEREYTSSTSQFAIDLGKSYGMSPMKIDYIMSQMGMFGSITRFAYDKMMGDAERPGLSTRDVIAKIAPGFVHKEFGTRAINDLYELRESVDEAYNTLNDIRHFTPAEAEKAHRDLSKLAGLKQTVDTYIKDLSLNRAAERRLIENPPPGMTKADREAAIRQIQIRNRQLLKNIELLRKQGGFDIGNPFRDIPPEEYQLP